ncbi:4Fe-4S ferredoxin [Synergistales bacterium]|nr:4Fe-4S ferredoxin [Synergistales bacterium]GHV51228.1 4Fe-4S ferredoxin [Synergistales bacterium]
MKLIIDTNKCIGCGVCMQIYPDVFELDDDEGRALIKEADEFDDAKLRDAIDNCPMSCINK